LRNLFSPQKNEWLNDQNLELSKTSTGPTYIVEEANNYNKWLTILFKISHYILPTMKIWY